MTPPLDAFDHVHVYVQARAAAVRELLKRGLAAEGFDLANRDTKSKDFGVVSEKPAGAKSGGRAGK